MSEILKSICPVCKKTADSEARPFCSSRCANIDLGRWLGEKYRMPTNETPTHVDRISDSSEDNEE